MGGIFASLAEGIFSPPLALVSSLLFDLGALLWGFGLAFALSTLVVGLSVVARDAVFFLLAFCFFPELLLSVFSMDDGFFVDNSSRDRFMARRRELMVATYTSGTIVTNDAGYSQSMQ